VEHVHLKADVWLPAGMLGEFSLLAKKKVKGIVVLFYPSLI